MWWAESGNVLRVMDETRIRPPTTTKVRVVVRLIFIDNHTNININYASKGGRETRAVPIHGTAKALLGISKKTARNENISGDTINK